MNNVYEKVKTCLASVREKTDFVPEVALILGSGLGDYADQIKKRYIRSGAVKEYGFTIIVTKSYSSYDDDVNLEAMTFAQGLMDWVEEKNRKKEYPEFPENCRVRKMEVLQNMPNLAGVNMEQLTARYMFQCRVTYYESEVRK